MEEILILESNKNKYKASCTAKPFFFFFHKVSCQAALASPVHEEMDIVKSPLITLMDQVKEVTKQYSGSAVYRITFQMDKDFFCLGALRHGG